MKKLDSKIRIVWLHSHFLYWMGGTKFIYEIVRRLKNYFHITVFVENSSPQAERYYRGIGVELVSLRQLTSTSVLYWLTLPLQLRKTTKVINSYLETKYPYQNCQIVTSMFPMNIVAGSLKSSFIQYCFEPFAFFHDPEFIEKFSWPKKIFIHFLKIVYQKADITATQKASRIMTLNTTTASLINDVYHRDSVISYTGIDTQHFKPYVSKILRNKYKGKKIIVHSTDYSPVKNTDLMIRIFAQIRKIAPEALLLITSTIKNRTEESVLKSLASNLRVIDSIEFLGFVDYNLLPQIYSLSKVLVQCSYSEKSGTTSMALPVKEAMSCGTLAVRYPIENEDVQNGLTGYLVDPRDIPKMVERIVTILRLPENKYRILSRKARQFIISRYTWDNTVDIFRKTIDEISRHIQ